MKYVFDFLEYTLSAFASPFAFVEVGVVAESATVWASPAGLDVESA
jgi:hypothetical protein